MKSKSQEYISLVKLILIEFEIKGWTQRRLAEKSGVSPSTINRLIKDRALLETENLLAILKALGLLDGIILKNSYKATKSPPPLGSCFTNQALERYLFLEVIIREVNVAAENKNLSALDLAEILINILRAECIKEKSTNPPRYPRRIKS